MTDSPQAARQLFPCQISERNPFEYLSFKDIAKQYPGGVTAETLYAWACYRKYGFHLIVTKIGSTSRVRRDRWEAFLDSRTTIANE